jgi:chorismate mutase/prephenate dehydrogenase
MKENWKIKLWISRIIINTLDFLMMKLIGWRMFVCRGIGRIKIKYKLPIYAPEREKEILRRRQAQGGQHGFSEKFVRILVKAILWESKRIQAELFKV